MNNAEDLNTANLQIGPEIFPGVFWEFHKTINSYSLKNTWTQAILMPKVPLHKLQHHPLYIRN